MEDILCFAEDIPDDVRDVRCFIGDVPDGAEDIRYVAGDVRHKVWDIPDDVEDVRRVMEDIPGFVEDVRCFVEDITDEAGDVPDVVDDVLDNAEDITNDVDDVWIPTTVELPPSSDSDAKGGAAYSGDCARPPAELENLFDFGCYNYAAPDGAEKESQRDSVPKPRVARHELPWVSIRKKFPTATRLRVLADGHQSISSAHQQPQPR